MVYVCTVCDSSFDSTVRYGQVGESPPHLTLSQMELDVATEGGEREGADSARIKITSLRRRSRLWNSLALVPRFVATILDLVQEVRPESVAAGAPALLTFLS